MTDQKIVSKIYYSYVTFLILKLTSNNTLDAKIHSLEFICQSHLVSICLSGDFSAATLSIHLFQDVKEETSTQQPIQPEIIKR